MLNDIRVIKILKQVMEYKFVYDFRIIKIL